MKVHFNLRQHNIFAGMVKLSEVMEGEFMTKTSIKDNLSRIDEFAINNTVLACDTDTAKRYGDI